MRSLRTALGAAALGTVLMLGFAAAPGTAAEPGSAAAPDAAGAAPGPGFAAARGAAGEAGLRAAARGTGVRIGTAVDMTALAGDAPYRDAVAREFDTVTAENVMKWGLLEPQQGVYDWAPADRLVDFARAHGQQVRGHTLVWHSQNPAWLTEANFTPASCASCCASTSSRVLRHFRGKIWAWDVVNEVVQRRRHAARHHLAAQPRPRLHRRRVPLGAPGRPAAKLFLNDYNIEWRQPQERRLLRPGQAAAGGAGAGAGIRHAGSPGPAVRPARTTCWRTCAASTRSAWRPPSPRWTSGCNCRPTRSRWQAQAEGFGLLLRACLLVRNCVSYTVWGFTDKYSWVPGVFDGRGLGDPVRRELPAEAGVLHDPRHVHPGPLTAAGRRRISAAARAPRAARRRARE